MNPLGTLDPWALVIWTGQSSRTVRLSREHPQCDKIWLQVGLIVDPYEAHIQIHFSGIIPEIYKTAPSLTEQERFDGVKNYFATSKVDEDFLPRTLLFQASPSTWGHAAITLREYADTQWTKYNNDYNAFLAALEEELPNANT
jgi:hypothetical protein